MCREGKRNPFTPSEQNAVLVSPESYHSGKPGDMGRVCMPMGDPAPCPPQWRTSSLELGSHWGHRCYQGHGGKRWQWATAEGGGLLGCVGGRLMAALSKHTLSLCWARKVHCACVSEENVKGETGDGSYPPQFRESSPKLLHELMKRYHVPEITSLGSYRLPQGDEKVWSPILRMQGMVKAHIGPPFSCESRCVGGGASTTIPPH